MSNNLKCFLGPKSFSDSEPFASAALFYLPQGRLYEEPPSLEQPTASEPVRRAPAHTHTPLQHALPTHRLTMPTQFSRVPAQLADAPVLPATRARPRDYRWRCTRPLSVNRHVSY